MKNTELRIPFTKIKNTLLVTALGASLLCIPFFVKSSAVFALSYLMAFLYWTGVILGALPLLMIHNLTGGDWGFPVRKTLETMAKIIPFLLVLFIPLAITMKHLYIWMDPNLVQHDHVLQEKVFYLNMPFFIFRTVVYFFVWTALAYLVTKGFQANEQIMARRPQASGIALIIYVLTVTFCSLDWAMSLEPHWNSTIYGFIFIIGQALSALAFVTFLVLLLSKRAPLKSVVTPGRSHDLGTLLFVLIMFWAYFNLSQFLIIWCGNLPETTPWYIRRFQGGWQVLGFLVVFFQFLMPFFLLLMRDIKRHPARLAPLAAFLLLVRWLDIFWYIKPALWKNLTLHSTDVLCWVAVGGWLLYVLFCNLEKAELVFKSDPALQGHGDH